MDTTLAVLATTPPLNGSAALRLAVADTQWALGGWDRFLAEPEAEGALAELWPQQDEPRIAALAFRESTGPGGREEPYYTSSAMMAGRTRPGRVCLQTLQAPSPA